MNEVVERLARLEEGQRRQDEKLDSIDGRLRKVERVAEFGQGAAWALLKFGAVAATLAVALTAIWEKARTILP